jgi:quercetin dioxygenase-like cupin family protein
MEGSAGKLNVCRDFRLTSGGHMVRGFGFGAGIVVGALATLAVVALVHFGGNVHAQAPGSTVLLDNERVNVVRAVAAAGTIEQPHAHGAEQNYVSIQLTPGDLEVTVGDQPTIRGSQGSVFWLPGNLTHTVNNRGKTPVDVIVVRIK